MKITVMIPTLNEEKSISKVVNDFTKQLPHAQIIVYDNGSTDNTVKIAREEGATVFIQNKRGKGNVVRAMFNNIESDIYIMVDGDDTYAVDNIKELVEPVQDGEADMVVGARSNYENKSFSLSHKFGNKLLTTIINKTFNTDLKDVLSGYRVMSREFVKEMILLSSGFEVESELTIRSLQEGYRIKEIPIFYRARKQGSQSKLKTIHDGWNILYTIITLFRDYNPIKFFSIFSLFFLFIGLIFGIKIVVEYISTGLLWHVGTAIFTVLMILLSTIIFMMGLLLSSVNNKWKITQETVKKILNNNIY